MIFSVLPLVVEIAVLCKFIIYSHEGFIVAANMAAGPIKDFSLLVIRLLRHKIAKLRHGRHHVAIGQLLFNLVNLHVHFLI